MLVTPEDIILRLIICYYWRSGSENWVTNEFIFHDVLICLQFIVSIQII